MKACLFGIYIPHIHRDVPFLFIGYLKKKEAKRGQDSASIKNVFCFETIKCLPVWLTPSSGKAPLRLQQNNNLPSFRSLGLQ